MKNKRSLFIVIAMVLLLAVVLGMGGTTFAKYISSDDTGTLTARVAKWGYQFTVDADELFGTDYSGTGLATYVADNGVSVNATEIAVAPGTTGSMTFEVTSGATEVAADVSYDVTVTQDIVLTEADGGIVDGYYPVTWTVTDGTTTKNYANLAAMKAAIDTDFGYTVAAGVSTDKELTITWAWDFDDSGAGTNDAYDTKLGQIAAGTATGTTSKTSLSFEITATATQIQVTPTP